MEKYKITRMFFFKISQRNFFLQCREALNRSVSKSIAQQLGNYFLLTKICQQGESGTENWTAQRSYIKLQ